MHDFVLQSISHVLRVFAAAALFYIALRLLLPITHAIFCHSVVKIFRKVNFLHYGKWAVITGATDGIGLAYAKYFASHGMSVMMISRSEEKLQRRRDEIQQLHHAEIDYIQADFTKGDIYDAIRRRLADIDVGVVVNNVGMSFGRILQQHRHARQQNIQSQANMIRCNAHSMARLSLCCLPAMLDKGKGVIINVASAGGILPSPRIALYSATKRFMDSCARGLDAELSSMEGKSPDIVTQNLLPFGVATNMWSRWDDSNYSAWTVVDADTYVRQSAALVGWQKRTHGCLAHDIMAIMCNMLPERVLTKLMNKLYALAG